MGAGRLRPSDLSGVRRWVGDQAVTTGNDLAITADTALRLSRFFGMSEGFWTGMQADYERELAKNRIGNALDAIRPIES